MKKLFQIVQERTQKQSEWSNLKREFDEKSKSLTREIERLKELENVAQQGINIELVQLAETVIYVRGNPYAKTDDPGILADLAVNDIANGCTHLKKEFFGNKTYSGYYQRCDCTYGYGPSHGGIRDEVGLHSEARKRELNDEEKDACIYYLKNYAAIMTAHKQIAAN